MPPASDNIDTIAIHHCHAHIPLHQTTHTSLPYTPHNLTPPASDNKHHCHTSCTCLCSPASDNKCHCHTPLPCVRVCVVLLRHPTQTPLPYATHMLASLCVRQRRHHCLVYIPLHQTTQTSVPCLHPPVPDNTDTTAIHHAHVARQHRHHCHTPCTCLSPPASDNKHHCHTPCTCSCRL